MWTPAQLRHGEGRRPEQTTGGPPSSTLGAPTNRRATGAPLPQSWVSTVTAAALPAPTKPDVCRKIGFFFALNLPKVRMTTLLSDIHVAARTGMTLGTAFFFRPGCVTT